MFIQFNSNSGTQCHKTELVDSNRGNKKGLPATPGIEIGSLFATQC